jgi:predicted small lipoprotein YifL
VRRLASLLAAALLVLGVAACGSGGGINLPTNLPTTIPTTFPTITLPTVPDVPTSTSRTEQQGTVTITQTSRPTTATVTSTVTTAPSAGPTGDGIPPWVWVVLAVLLLALVALVIWLVRRAQARRAWDDRMALARRNALWVEDALVQQVMSRGTTAEAAATWRAAQPRLMSLDEMLYSLATDAPDPDRANEAAALRSRVQNLVDAMGADTSTGQDASADDLRARRAAVSSARSELRQFLDAANALR